MVNIISKNRKTASNIMFSIILMGILICSTICSPVFASTVFSDSSSVSGYIPAFIDTSHLRDKSYEIKDPISSNANRMLKNTSSISSLDIPSYYDNRDKLIEPGNQRGQHISGKQVACADGQTAGLQRIQVVDGIFHPLLNFTDLFSSTDIDPPRLSQLQR